MRSLVQQRGEQDRRLLIIEEELKKVEAKLLAAVRERTSLAANVTTLERQRAELRKVNEFLKSKVCYFVLQGMVFEYGKMLGRTNALIPLFVCFFKVSVDTSKKRINSLTMDLMEARNSLDAKNKVLYVCAYKMIQSYFKSLTAK